MITTLQSIILGIIEGLTEFLPISSTAHLILYNYFTGVQIDSEAVKTLQIAIQIGAIGAIVVYYFKDLIKIDTIKLLIVGVLPTIVLGLLFKNSVSLFQEMPKLIAFNLIVGGIIILIVERMYKKRNIKSIDGTVRTITYRQSAIFGAVQSIAMIPGVSRSAAIIVYGVHKNYNREVIAQYTFLLAVPTMIAATTYSVLKNYESIMISGGFENIILATIVAFFTALLVVRYALPFVKKYSFVPFGWYRIILGCVVLGAIHSQ